MKNFISFFTLPFFFFVLSAWTFEGDVSHIKDSESFSNSDLESEVEFSDASSIELTKSPMHPNYAPPCPEGVLDVDNDGICDDADLCIDDTACNYDGSLTTNAPCDYEECAGCMSQLACNFDSDATLDDGSCVFANDVCSYCSWDTLDASSVNGQNPQDGSGTLIGNNADGDTICDFVRPVALTPVTLDNCFDTDMCNYADPDNGSCTLHTEYYYDADEDSLGEYSLGFFCGTDVPTETPYTDYRLPGEWDECTNRLKCNYNWSETNANAACQEDRDGDRLCDGVESIDDAGVKSYSVDLCVDGQAPNYDNSDTLYVNAGTNNEPCCIDGNGNGVCDDREIFGCTDSYACNYVSFANLDDGSCAFVGEETELSSNSTEQYATSINQENNLCATCLTGGDSIRVPNTALTLLGHSSLADGGSADTTKIMIDLYVSNDSDGDGVCDDDEQVGCADTTACNYAVDAFGNDFPLATLGDDSEYIIVRTLANGETISDSVFVTEPCYYDVD
ncbi:MAG: hypothetical protein CL834_06065, partial [Crocinitomicaceae bacterium]|nr:hypothetical protein [Crocinitomicaceae bacterium]